MKNRYFSIFFSWPKEILWGDILSRNHGECCSALCYPVDPVLYGWEILDAPFYIYIWCFVKPSEITDLKGITIALPYSGVASAKTSIYSTLLIVRWGHIAPYLGLIWAHFVTGYQVVPCCVACLSLFTSFQGATINFCAYFVFQHRGCWICTLCNHFTRKMYRKHTSSNIDTFTLCR